jgi:hypothetical protein
VRWAGQDFTVHEGPEGTARSEYRLQRKSGAHATLHPPLNDLAWRTRQVHEQSGATRKESERYLRICDFDVQRAVNMIRGDWSRRQNW